jgi:hypothetical protein
MRRRGDTLHVWHYSDPCLFQIQDDKAKLLYELDSMQEQLEKANMLVNRYTALRMRQQ